MKDLTVVSRKLAWAWIIILGGLIITPGGIDCFVCGPIVNNVLGLVSILLGISGLVVSLREESLSR